MFFKKVACFTDIHFGMKGNSRVHNDDCEAFIYWFIEQAKAEGQKKIKLSDFTVSPRKIDKTDLVFRVMTYDHIPDDVDRKRNPKNEADKKVKINLVFSQSKLQFAKFF